MLRDLLKEGGLYTLANLATKGVSLLLIPFYSDYFTTAEYGILALLGISGALMTAIFSFQIYQGVSRYISEKKNTLVEQQKIGSSGLFFTIISYSVFTLLALLFKDVIIDYLSEEDKIEDSTYYWWLSTLAISGIFYTLGVQLRFLRKTKQFTLISFLHAFLNIIFILIFALGLDYRIDSVFIANAIVTPFIILLQIYFLKDYLIVYLGKKELRKLFRFSVPLIPAAIAYLVLNFTDRVFIKDINDSLGAVGIYDMAFKFSAIVSIIIMAFQSALAPLIYEKHHEKNTPIELGRIFRLFVGIGSFGILCLASLSFETLYIFTQPQYYEASILMPLFYLSVLVTGIGMFSPGLHVKKRTELIPIAVIISGLVNVGLNLWFIPIYGLFGAALATLISTFLNNLILFIISQSLYRIPVNYKRLFAVITTFMIIFLFVSYLDYFWSFNYLISLTIRLILIILYLSFLVQIKFISFDGIKKRLIRKSN